MKDLKIYLIIGFSLLFAYCVILYNQPKPVDWKPTYLNTDKIPYGTYIAYQRLPDIFPKATIRSSSQPVYNTLVNNNYRKGSYILIAYRAALDQNDYDQLVDYMKQGNTVFIATFYLNKFLRDTLKLKINSERLLSIGKKTKINFTNPSLKTTKDYVFERVVGAQYFSRFDTSRAIILGKNQYAHANFLRYDFGKGHLYLLPSPDFFTNFNMLNPRGNDYAAKTLSYLPPKGEVIWDEYFPTGDVGNSSPMRVFLSHPQLKWAYFIALFSLLFFVLYEIKRRQRIIPIADPLQNTTVEFIGIVGQLYYQQRDNLNIASKKLLFFWDHVRSKYQLKTNEVNEELIRTLTDKSGVNAEIVQQIFQYVDRVKSAKRFSDKELIDLNHQIEQFYQQSGL